ncbi:TPA: AAA family ATPase [Acinetobacter baumannii]
MKTIVVAMRKGGTGKTTSTRNIAVELTRRGHNVLLVDTDTQGSLTTWWKTREAETPQLLVTSPSALSDALDKAEKAGYEYVLIDSAPLSNEAISATVQYADFVLIPMKAGSDDLRAVGQTIKLVKELNKPFAFVLNEVKSNAVITRKVAEAVSQYGPLAPSQPSRIQHVEAPVNGLTCIDLGMSNKASKDVVLLTDYVIKRLESLDE